MSQTSTTSSVGGEYDPRSSGGHHSGRSSTSSSYSQQHSIAARSNPIPPTSANSQVRTNVIIGFIYKGQLVGTVTTSIFYKISHLRAFYIYNITDEASESNCTCRRPGAKSELHATTATATAAATDAATASKGATTTAATAAAAGAAIPPTTATAAATTTAATTGTAYGGIPDL